MMVMLYWYQLQSIEIVTYVRHSSISIFTANNTLPTDEGFTRTKKGL